MKRFFCLMLVLFLPSLWWTLSTNLASVWSGFLAVIDEEIKIEQGGRDFISPYRFRNFLLPRNASGGTIRFTVFPGLLLNSWSTGI